MVVVDDGWRPPIRERREVSEFILVSLLFILSNRKHRTIKRGILDELVGDVCQSHTYTSYHYNPPSHKES